VTADTGVYLYGVVAAGRIDGGPLAARPGVAPDRSPRIVTVGSVDAIVADVPLDEFDEETLPARLNDLEWLEAAARAHEDVLELALATTGVVPFRFCTVYRSEENLRRFVAGREDVLAAVLERVEGHVELGVKGLVAAQGVVQSGEEAADAETESPGRSYLLRRQRDRRSAEESARTLADSAASAHERLSAVAVDAALLPLRPPQDAGEERMFLNGAYLAPAGDESLAREAAALTDEYGALGIRFELTGPWPPYNFVPPDALAQ
jgi:hypothetical protein